MKDLTGYEPLVTSDDLPPDLSAAGPSTVAAAVDAIRSYCGWHIAPPVAEVLDGSVGTRLVTLPTLHLTAVTAVETRTGGTLTVEDWSHRGQITLDRPPGVCEVQASVTHGLAACPPAVVEVIADIVRDLQSSTEGPSISSVKLDGADIDYRTPQDVGVRRRIGSSYGHILDRYKL